MEKVVKGALIGGLIGGLVGFGGPAAFHSAYFPNNNTPSYANPRNLEFKVEDVITGKKKETILIDKQNDTQYIMERDKTGTLKLVKYPDSYVIDLAAYGNLPAELGPYTPSKGASQ